MRLPKPYRFEGTEVYIRRNAATGEVILSPRPTTWADFFAIDKTTDVPQDFMSESDRRQTTDSRDPFDEPPR